MVEETDVLIIGGGPAGMACAWELAKEGREVLVLEREDRPGGLARTLDFDFEGVGSFRSDIGPHRFFSKNRYLYQMMEDLLGPKWILVERFTRFHIGGMFYLYPPQIRDVLKGMGLRRSARVLAEMLWERCKAAAGVARRESFEDYMVGQFGRTLAEFNILNYTEKIWGISCGEISPDWAEQRIQGVSIVSMLKRMLTHRVRGGGVKSLADEFYYPETGAGLTYEIIRDRLRDCSFAKVRTGCEVMGIERGERRIEGVRFLEDGQERRCRAKHVVSTMLLSDLVRLMEPVVPSEILKKNKTLKYRSQVYVFLALDRERVGPDNWVYFPDKEVPFGRFYEPKTFSEGMCPPGKTSLWLEHFVFEGDEVWNRRGSELARLDAEWLVKLGFLKSEREVLGFRHHRERNVYPVYDRGYKERLTPVLRYLEGFSNLFLAGRGARFRYTNQDHSLEMGILSAQSILRGVRLDVENVGGEREYFEKGYVPFQRKVLENAQERKRK